MSKAPANQDITRRYGGQSLADRRNQRREQFLAAGLEVFGTSGFRQATVRQLCRQADLTDRYFYESFDSIEALLMAVYSQQFDRLDAELRSMLARDVGRIEASRVVRQSLQILFAFVSDPRVGRVCWLEVLGVSPQVDALYNSVVERYAALMSDLAKALNPEWTLSRLETRILGISAVGALSEVVTHWILSGYQENRTGMIRASHTMLLRLLGI
ncbi:MAG TPA: TetR/AcrR family transcriptional regulator [Aquabacterium sp.]|nr:TetR/AcrR family transcriptional regulator [Aquabacterium sp.]